MKKLISSTLLFSNLIFAQSIPGVGGMLPTSGSGYGPQTFTATINLPLGPGNGDYMLISIGGWTPGCVIMIRPLDNIMYILNDAGTGWQSPATIGSNVVIENNVCSVNAAAAFKWVYAYSEVAAVSITLKPGFSGSNPGWAGVYAYSGASNTTSNWVTTGTWTVPPQTLDITLSATEINNHELLLDDATGQYIEKPTSGNPWVVQLRSGLKVKVPNAADVRISKISYSWEPTADGALTYHYVIDTKDNPYIMRLGVTEDQFSPVGELAPNTHPEGWLGMGVGWVNLDGKAKLASNSEFSLESKWKPGLQALFVMSHKAKEPIPSFSGTEDNIRIATAASIFNNSTRKFVIGPAFAPEATPEDVKLLLDRWVNDYGFVFLDPLLQGTQTLDEIQTNDPFEQEVLKCLRDFGKA